MFIEKLEINEWQQFEKVDIDFHDKLTILTWANWSWKTTILSNILAKHCGWNIQSIKTPKKNKIKKVFEWFSKWKEWENEIINSKIWKIIYSNNISCEINEPNWNSAGYNIQLKSQQAVESFYIPSHRTIFKYERVNNIPTTAINKKIAFQKVSNTNRERYQWNWGWQSSSFFIKETLISWNIFWKWNDSMEANELLLENYNWFEEILRKVLPTSLWFNKFTIRSFEVLLVCDSWDFIIDWASWWISAIIDLSWQLFMYSDNKQLKFTAIIDEVENHLHPKMQREILPNLLEAFPSVRFIVSTHSPLLINSVRESSVYVLTYNENNRIISQLLDLNNNAKTSSDILDEVLGVWVTIPMWAENKLEEIIKKYSSKDLENRVEFSNLRKELEDNWLWNFVPKAILELIKNKND